jgi:hypothetical protein
MLTLAGFQDIIDRLIASDFAFNDSAVCARPEVNLLCTNVVQGDRCSRRENKKCYREERRG